jgi:hypothetical protein
MPKPKKLPMVGGFVRLMSVFANATIPKFTDKKYLALKLFPLDISGIFLLYYFIEYEAPTGKKVFSVYQ